MLIVFIICVFFVCVILAGNLLVSISISVYGTHHQCDVMHHYDRPDEFVMLLRCCKGGAYWRLANLWCLPAVDLKMLRVAIIFFDFEVSEKRSGLSSWGKKKTDEGA